MLHLRNMEDNRCEYHKSNGTHSSVIKESIIVHIADMDSCNGLA